MYDQRIPEPARDEEAGIPWRPDGVPFDDDAPDPTLDHYVAIDRIDAAVATLDVAPWPIVDPATGRLRFEPAEARATVVASTSALRRRVDVDRRDLEQLQRPLRPGDVFWVRGMSERPDAWQRVMDVTRAGRFAAKAALLATAVGAPSIEDSGSYGLEGAEMVETAPRPAPSDDEGGDPPPPPGPVAFPAV